MQVCVTGTDRQFMGYMGHRLRGSVTSTVSWHCCHSVSPKLLCFELFHHNPVLPSAPSQLQLVVSTEVRATVAYSLIMLFSASNGVVYAYLGVKSPHTSALRYMIIV